MDTLYHATNKLIQQTQDSFKNLESSTTNYAEVEAEIQTKIDTINANCEKLDVLLYKIPPNQRPNAKMRCDQLKYDTRHLQAALESCRRKRERKELALSEREQLLNRRFAPNPELTAIDIDYALKHQNSLQNANRGVDEMLMTGANVLESLRSQRFTIKGAQRRIRDMANTLGLSNQTMRMIEKRVGEDKIILLLGMVVTLVVIVLVIIYLA